jgi:hypothetical protein
LLKYWDAIINNAPERMPEQGQKIYDFIDSSLGKDTRTFYGDDPLAGAPAVADVHSMRDMGYVDHATRDWVRNNYGDNAADQLELDAFEGGPSETQYEYAADKMRGMAGEMNKRNYMGGDWTPAQLQAVGWTVMSKMLGRQAMTSERAITENVRNLSYELDFGAGAPFNEKFPEWHTLDAGQKTAVSHAVLPKIVDVAKQITGAEEFGRLEGLGGWHQFTNAAYKSRLVASPEVAGDVADIIGYLGQQTKVFGYRYQPNGNKLGIAIHNEALRDPAVAQKLWDRLNAEHPDFAAGFSPSVAPDGTYGIEILSDRGGAQVERRIASELIPSLDAIGKDLYMDLAVDAFRANEESREHDWEKDPSGGSYLSRLSARYGPEISKRLELYSRQELEPALLQAIAEAKGTGSSGGRAGAGGAGDQQEHTISLDAYEPAHAPSGSPIGGQFVSKGGGGGAAPIKSSTWTGRTTAPSRSARVAVGKGTRVFKNLTKKDYEIFKQHLPNAQKTLGQNLAGLARAGGALLKAHGKEELHKAKHAAGALGALTRGHRPTPEQTKSLAEFGVSLLMSAASMVTHGDPTGAIPHLVVALGQELVNDAITTHAAKLGVSMGRYAYHVTTGGGDAELDEPNPEDVKLLRDFAATLAQVVATKKIPEARLAELLGQEPDGAEPPPNS